jgi:hypothetical protein
MRNLIWLAVAVAGSWWVGSRLRSRNRSPRGRTIKGKLGAAGTRSRSYQGNPNALERSHAVPIASEPQEEQVPIGSQTEVPSLRPPEIAQGASPYIYGSQAALKPGPSEALAEIQTAYLADDQIEAHPSTSSPRNNEHDAPRTDYAVEADAVSPIITSTSTLVIGGTIEASVDTIDPFSVDGANELSEGVGLDVQALASGPENAPDAREAQAAVCPRCGTSSNSEDEDRVFGFRVMRSASVDGTITVAVRRQSYCRKCRTEHAAEIRHRRARLTPGVDEDRSIATSGPVESDPAARPVTDAEVEPSVEEAVDLDCQSGDARRPVTPLVDQQDHDPSLNVGEIETLDLLDGSTGSGESELSRLPSPYRAPSGRRPPAATVSRSKVRTSTADTRARAAAIDVRVLFDRHGGCSISLLPKQPTGWPDTVRISVGTSVYELEQLQEGWYGELEPSDMGAVLLQGVIWRDHISGREWLLTGRELFVFAAHPELRGFISCPRLASGRKHVVLYRSSLAQEIETVLNEAGCSNWMTVPQDGIPTGWAALRDVVPQQAVPQNHDADILNILRPLPEVDIQLEGGVHIGQSNWLLGRPPVVRIYGPSEALDSVLIDGRVASADPSGAFSVPALTELGDHEIWCGGVSRRFSIVTASLPSTVFDAHRFESAGSNIALSICGPLVHQMRHRSNGEEIVEGEDPGPPVALVSQSHPVLIGANPGEVQIVPLGMTSSRFPTLVRLAFEPLWGLPRMPLLADKRYASIRYFGPPSGEPPTAWTELATSDYTPQAIQRWCAYLLDASRKNLALENTSSAVKALWRAQRLRAYNLRRRHR